jgi:exopolysaccharide production protein ExoY
MRTPLGEAEQGPLEPHAWGEDLGFAGEGERRAVGKRKVHGKLSLADVPTQAIPVAREVVAAVEMSSGAGTKPKLATQVADNGGVPDVVHYLPRESLAPAVPDQLDMARAAASVREFAATAPLGVPSSRSIEEPGVLRYWEGLALVTDRPSKARRSARCKRAVDVVGALGALLVLLPVLVVIALVMKSCDGGSIFYGHRRLGRGGRPFRCWKFRTMRTGTDCELVRDEALWREYVHSDFKLVASANARVTRPGRWLRRTRLDELPQLWNVLKGDLSLVGPRPIVEAEAIWYGPLIDELLSIRPGMTGLWQASSEVRYPERALLELEYATEPWSLARDARILGSTVIKVLTGRFDRQANLDSPFCRRVRPR